MQIPKTTIMHPYINLDTNHRRIGNKNNRSRPPNITTERYVCFKYFSHKIMKIPVSLITFQLKEYNQ